MVIIIVEVIVDAGEIVVGLEEFTVVFEFDAVDVIVVVGDWV